MIIDIDRSIGETQEMPGPRSRPAHEMTAEIRRLEETIAAAEADRQEERQRGFVADARVIPVVVLGVI